ncbi:midasin [Epithele typhae]|uniref:midasin n=1 Tax=Epithele typhae TaxID=378194 RepID=UPI002008CB46|nr:midasin [Epithele typhae]KAH9924312.1 midasin [Epithele typhae]
MTEQHTPFPDPLRFDLKGQVQKLHDLLPARIPYANASLQNAPSRRALLDALSALLHVPHLTMTVSTLFRPILIDLCARWLEEELELLDKLESLCLMLEVHQELFPCLYSVLASLLRLPVLERGPLHVVPSNPPPSNDILQRILLVYYRILQANRSLPRSLGWPLSPLSKLVGAQDLPNGVRFLAIRCYSLQAGMMEGERVKLEKEVLGEVSQVECKIAFGYGEDGNPREVDGWVLPVLELERVTQARNAPLIANIHGVLMLRSDRPTPQSSPLVDTPTTSRALQQIALHLSLDVPILLTSAPSSGKSLLISHLAQTLHPSSRNHVVTIHLADTSLDPRSLLGSYVSSPSRPGTFEWKEGVLVRAMREGKWVVLEDIDRATMEMLGVLKPLVESLGADKWIGGRARLNVPSRGMVEAQASFALFATRSLQLSRQGTFPSPTFFGAHKFYEAVMDSPGSRDLRTIVDSKFPRLAGALAQGAINLWEGVRAVGISASIRDPGIRELEKFCTRVGGLLPSNLQTMDCDEDLSQPLTLDMFITNPTIREDIYLEARDVFFGVGATTASGRAHLDAVARVAATHLGITEERMHWILNNRTSEFDIEKDVNGRIVAVRAGRSRLPARASSVDMAPAITRPFAMHRPAMSLISRLASAIALGEPLLLTGETGTGKTSVVTHLAALLRRPLISLNLSNQTESSDILGGFKPVDARIPGGELYQRFVELFGALFNRKKQNAQFEDAVRKAVQERKWKRAAAMWLEAVRMAKDKLTTRQAEEDDKELEGGTSRKRRKANPNSGVSVGAWEAFEHDVRTFEIQHVQGKSKFAFAFVEGPLVKALRNGDWILLDEVNLATSETLESISSLLHGPTASITLTEQGSLEPIPRHPDFRLFACMNPATDVGKKDLPPHIRSRFTELDVPPPDADKDTLLTIVAQYIGGSAVGDKGAIMDVAEFYTAVKGLAEERQIADGANHRPHFSMRTLARALTFASDMAPSYSLRRALWEGCLMAFTMALDSPSAAAVTALAQKHLLAGVRNQRSLLMKEPLPPGDPSAFVKLGPFYLERGPYPEDIAEDYIMTPSVETKLIDLARIIAAKRFPVLIEGPTSSGKTSSIEYLAKRTGHRFVRINNHEHTDIQEYIGTYVSDPITGKLVFKEGLLVRALRQGDWIVLDELNLAPTDVLEALNRLLDDNRELVIPETQEVVRPHPHFMLFATQNPPGLYAGRKILSRAFRNRFLEVHFEDVPQAELETILCQRCRIAPSYGQRIVSVFRELQKRRQTSRVFESKQGFATLRDLFRWAGRDAVGYEELATNGYMLLAERARRDDDKAVVKEVIEKVMKVRIDESSLYDLQRPKFDPSDYLGCPMPSSTQIVWTAAMQRLFVLTARALRFNEPVLLVGETGCGKTSVCQLYAEVLCRTLQSVNCHQNTETADLIGGLRPIRNKAATEVETVRETVAVLSELGISLTARDPESLVKVIDKLLKSPTSSPEHITTLHEHRARLQRLSALFEWRDGALVEAMRNGDVFLLDEISLADDSVLERLNSVLETGRTIVLAECGSDSAEIPAIKADDDFKLVATMNPGGDYGKKELSPALRNRFTEIWVPAITDRRDLECIVQTLWQHDSLKVFTQPLLDFVEWLCSTVGDHTFANLRDILAWVSFSNATLCETTASSMTASEIFHHAAEMTFLDGLGTMPQLAAYSKEALGRLRSGAVLKLNELAPTSIDPEKQAPSGDDKNIHFGPFAIPRGPLAAVVPNFSLEAPTTRDNVMRVVRACQLPKPIMLEGSPGVGKTSLVAALANICGHSLCRINLSDQTDLVDLFGCDLPVEGGEPGQFAWKDAEFLRALQEGHWILLDEMNLAPQSVLEGLNAVLDHRGTVYIPELGRSFVRHPSFRIFAAQNPLHQGGGRKGLPKSFLNRFTKVYVQEMSPNDLLLICRNLFPRYPEDLLQKMISYMSVLNEETMVMRSFAREGAPWEFNLRDVIRWASLLQHPQSPVHPAQFLFPIILQRFRTPEDRRRAYAHFSAIFSTTDPITTSSLSISPSSLQIGHHQSARATRSSTSRTGCILQASLSPLESLGMCIKHGWLAILTGPRDSGKTSIARTIADMSGHILHEVSINNATDASDILGSFEEIDLSYSVNLIAQELLDILDDVSRSHLPSPVSASDLPAIVRSFSQVLDSLEDLPSQYRSKCARARIEVGQLSSRCPQAAQLQWVDGALVRALKEGHWILLDGANLCNPSVLDRLNSLCEIGGSLTLNERGAVNGEVQVLRPHPNFRLFMCVDSQYGELSRAMRNRGIEIALSSTWNDEDIKRILTHIRCFPNTVDNEFSLKRSIILQAQIRRGLQDLETPALLDISSCRLALEDSVNAAIADLVPTLRPSPPTHPNRALNYFIASHVAPLSFHHHHRFLSSTPSETFCSVRSLLEALECSHICSTTIQMRMDFSQTLHVPSDALLAQPFAIVPQSTLVIEPGTKILRLLRLLVSTSVDYGQPLEEPDIDMLSQTVSFGRFLRQAIDISVTFDFSLAFAMVEWFRQALATTTSDALGLRSIVDGVKALEETVSLTSGLALTDLWQALSIPIAIDRTGGKITALECASQLRTQISDVMAMWTMPASNVAQEDVLLALTVQLELNLPTSIYAWLTTALQILKELVDYGHSDPEAPLKNLMVFRRLAWFVDSQESPLSTFTQAQAQWLNDLWDASSVGEVSCLALQRHFHELTHISALGALSTLPPTMAKLSSHEAALRRRIGFLTGQLMGHTSRASQMANMLAGTVVIVSSSSGPFDKQLFDQSVPASLSGPYHRHLRLPLLALMGHDDTASFLKLGQCWIALSRFLLELYVPNIPIDPAAILQCSQRFLSEQRALLEDELALQRAYEKRTIGRPDNFIIQHLSESLQTLIHNMPTLCSTTSNRTSIIQLHAYWTEVSQFLDQVISPVKIDAIISALKTKGTSAQMREQVVQESIAAFSRRLDSVYPEYRDISGPIHLALLQLRLGLRLLADVANSDEADIKDLGSTAGTLVSFPPSIASLRVRQSLGQHPSSSQFSHVLWRLAAASIDVFSGADCSVYIPQIAEIYEQALGLWLIDKARKEEAERQAQSLYRNESNAVATEAENEEQDFLSLFPEYEDLLDEDAPQVGSSTSRKSSDLVGADDVRRLSTIHLSLFVQDTPQLSPSHIDLQRRLAREILITHSAALPEVLDSSSRPYQISILLDHLSVLHGASRSVNKPYNFYADPNHLGARDHTARSLIKEWPDQMVLQHLHARCEAILSLGSISPVAKVLSAIEQLLLQMEDWEMYANRENTLKAYQQDLVSTVVSWRRLELSSWKGLLHTQAQEFAEGTSEWWFRLYEATVRGASAAAQEEDSNINALATYLEGLVPLLDTFITSSPLGQFTARLDLLRAFEVFVTELANIQIGEAAAASRRVHNILYFTRIYYSQFTQKVAASLSSQQSSLEKEIRNFIKLASWKDINVHALKQSAQRTHRQLYKCIRKFKEVLRQPITAHLVPGAAGSDEQNPDHDPLTLLLPAEIAPLPAFSGTVALPDHLLHLDKTIRNFRAVIGGRISSVIGSLVPIDLEELSADIITNMQTLASSSPPPATTKEQKEKFYKALLVRKRKAWSDLLKELKRIGLAVNMKPEVLEQQSSPRWLREQRIAEHDEALPHFDKSEKYLMRLTKLLPELRASLSSHHDDIGLRDLQRGTNLVESAFSFALEARASFVEAVNEYHQLRINVARLQQAYESPRIAAVGVEAYHRVTTMKEDLGRLCQALDEIVVVWRRFLQEIPETEPLPVVIAEAETILSSSRTFLGRLVTIAETLKSSQIPALLEGEAAVIKETLEHVETVSRLLVGWNNAPNVVAHFTKPVLEWLQQSSFSLRSQLTHGPREVASDNTGGLIDRLLLSVQGILALPMPTASTRLISQVTRALKISDVRALLDEVTAETLHAHPDELSRRLARALPFLDTYLALALAQLANHCAWTKSLFKLDYVICTVVRAVARDGFCKPPEGAEGEAGEAGTQDADGMGLGEGAGTENVSKEIEDESQVEGLQGEADADEDVERAEEDNAVEMSEDFGGKMQDVPEKEDGEGEEQEQDEDDVEPEEQVGDLDAMDPSAVDEKLWGDESGPDDTRQDDGKADDHSTKQQEKESEMAAKEDQKGKRPKEQPKKQDEGEAATQESGDGEEEEAMQEDRSEDGEDETGQDQQGGAPLDDFVQDAKTLDLPDDLDFGKEGEKDRDIDDDIEMEDGDGEEGDEEDEARPGDDVSEEAEDGMVIDPDNPQVAPDDQPPPEGVTEDIVDGATAQPDLHAGSGQDSGEQGEQAVADATQGEGGQGPSSSGEAGMVEAQDGAGATHAQQGAAPSQSKPRPLQSNPLRSLGDALREIKQRMDDIMESDGTQSRPEQNAPEAQNSQLEYLRPENDIGAEEMQALGPAYQEDVAKLNDLKFLDEDMEDLNTVPPVEDPPSAASDETTLPPQSFVLQSESTGHALSSDVKSALTQTEIRSRLPDSSQDHSVAPVSADVSMSSDEPEEQDAQQNIELALRQWQAEGQPELGAEDMWRKYEALTHDLSYTLCEQLRLILEPTMATRLRGDYRTGKRLNMKKIIPYIASEFTKDKIWLRRTRPSQREYQVLIALDDSRSMAESHSVHLAFQTLALVANALGKLEVGDVAIARFGETVDVLHGFDGGPFSQQAGARVMQSFRFDQRATQVLSLVETSLGVLARARERRAGGAGSAADLWQLEIIVSDGICEDHDKLRAVLRRAEEQRIMVVFVIIDSLHSKGVAGATGQNESSILSVVRPTIKMVDGKVDLQMARYLDTFPFEYYVVLRNVEALPDVLAATLKQFFERIAEA